MLNFETDLDQARRQGQHTIVSTVPQVRETLTITRPPAKPPVEASREVRTTDVGKAPESWGWEDLRNYVVRQIETFNGPFPIDPPKLRAIFQGFSKRHGEMAGPIAVAAFDLHAGRWKGAPISVTRFCAKSDPYFADEIKARLVRT